MAILYAIGGVWAVVAALVLIVGVIAVPPRDVPEFGLRLQGALGWFWFVGTAAWWLTGRLMIKADQS